MVAEYSEHLKTWNIFHLKTGLFEVWYQMVGPFEKHIWLIVKKVPYCNGLDYFYHLKAEPVGLGKCGSVKPASKDFRFKILIQ
jgi:hypothetical protein